jgi:hypothetical protein
MQNANKTRGIGPLGSSGVIANWGASSLIRSVQRGTISVTGATSATATVSAVNLDHTRLRFLGARASLNVVDGTKYFAHIQLTNATTITATVTASPGANTCLVSWELTEYAPGVIKSIQRGTTTAAGGAATATITRVDPAKSELTINGFLDADTSNNNGVFCTGVITDGVTLTFTNTVAVNITPAWEVVEYF